MHTIKRFADILWDIVSSRPFAISEAREFDPSKTILTKMINKKLTFNEIVAEIE